MSNNISVLLTARSIAIIEMGQFIAQHLPEDSVRIEEVNDGGRHYLLDSIVPGKPPQIGTQVFKIRVHFKTEEYQSLFYLKWPEEFCRVRDEK